MGGLPSAITNFDPREQRWNMQQGDEGVTIWTHPQTREQIEQYHFVVSDASELAQEEKAFKMRYNSEYLVAGRYFKNFSQAEVCSSMHKSNLFIERIPYRLSRVQDIPYPDVLHIYRQAVRGFDILQQFAGPFDINQDMICFNNQGKTKVWLNSNLSRGLPQLRFDGSSATQAGMVRRLIDLIQTNSTYQQSQSVKKFLHQRSIKTFAQANLALQQYSRLFNAPIPNVMQCLQQPSNVSKLMNTNTNQVVQKVTKIPEIPIHRPTNPAAIHSTQVKSHLNVAPPQLTQHQVTSINNQYRPISSIHHQRQSSHLNNPVVNSIITPIQRKLNHSQSLLNIFYPPTNHQQLNRNTIDINNTNRKHISTQSLIHVKSPQKNIINRQTSRFNQKHLPIQQLYPKKLDRYRVQQSYSKNKPLEFKTSATKPKIVNNKIIPNTKNQTNNFTPYTHPNPIPNPNPQPHPKPNIHLQPKIFQPIQNNNIPLNNRPKSNTLINTNRNTNAAQLTPTQRNTSNTKSIINQKYQSIKPQLVGNQPIVTQHSSIQFHQQKQKVSQVYRQQQIKRNTQPKRASVSKPVKQKISFAPKYIQEQLNKNQQINTNRIAHPSSSITQHTNINTNQTYNQNQYQQVTSQSLKNENVTTSIESSQTPLALTSKYFNPSASHTIEPFKYTHNTSNNTQNKITQTSSSATYSHQTNNLNGNILNSQTNGVTYSFGNSYPNTYGTIRQQSQSINVSRQTNHQFNIESQLMGDLQRLRINALMTKSPPI